MKENFTISFFGHRTVEDPKLIFRRLLRMLDEVTVDCFDCCKPVAEKIIFYCGGYGEFDSLASKAIDFYRKKHTEQKTEKVLVVPYITPSYMESVKHVKSFYDAIVYPQIDNVMPKEEIIARNRWMIDRSDAVIFYRMHNFSNTEKFLLYAKNCGKPIYHVGKGERLEVPRRL